MKRLLTTIAVITAVAGCEKLRGRPSEAECVTWDHDVRAVLEARCSTCHSGPAPEAGLDFSTYQATIQTATAGDERSRILQKLHPEQADVLPTLEAWVVDCRLALRDSAIHAPGLQNPRDPDFHGALLASLDYDFALCAKCHGERFDGGGAQASCLSCHPKGPTDCSTCHRAPTPEHRAHARFDCARCHQVPGRWDDPGHLDGPPAEVRFDGAGATAMFDPAEARCTGVTCHGGGYQDSAATNTTPTWHAGEDQAACGTCHGIPPSSHASDQCESCHPISNHIDGVVQLGRSETGCRGCHGTPEAPAPDDRGHRSHLDPQLGLRGPIACGDCHLVPSAIDSPGHIDSAPPAEVFPSGIAAASLAFARGAQPTWDHETATCAGTYCHGPATPSWTSGETFCGSCHGIPPQDANHDPSLKLSDCASCHPSSVDQYGNPRSTHLDGHVDL